MDLAVHFRKGTAFGKRVLVQRMASIYSCPRGVFGSDQLRQPATQ